MHSMRGAAARYLHAVDQLFGEEDVQAHVPPNGGESDRHQRKKKLFKSTQTRPRTVWS